MNKYLEASLAFSIDEIQHQRYAHTKTLPSITNDIKVLMSFIYVIHRNMHIHSTKLFFKVKHLQWWSGTFILKKASSGFCVLALNGNKNANCASYLLLPAWWKSTVIIQSGEKGEKKHLLFERDPSESAFGSKVVWMGDRAALYAPRGGEAACANSDALRERSERWRAAIREREGERKKNAFLFSLGLYCCQ